MSATCGRWSAARSSRPLSRAGRHRCRRSTASGPTSSTSPAWSRRVTAGGVREVIVATNATVDGQTTAHYLAERLAELRRAARRAWRMACRSAASSTGSTTARWPPRSRRGARSDRPHERATLPPSPWRWAPAGRAGSITYAAVLVLGGAQRLGPGQPAARPAGAGLAVGAGRRGDLLFALNFFADKIPPIDSIERHAAHLRARAGRRPAGLSARPTSSAPRSRVIAGAAGRHPGGGQPHRQDRHAGADQHLARAVQQHRRARSPRTPR